MSELLRIGENLVRVGKQLICAEPWRESALYTHNAATILSDYAFPPAVLAPAPAHAHLPMCSILRNAYVLDLEL